MSLLAKTNLTKTLQRKRKYSYLSHDSPMDMSQNAVRDIPHDMSCDASQTELKNRLYQIVRTYPKTGLYEKEYSRTQRIEMFIDYVYYQHNELKNKKSYIISSEIIRDFEMCMISATNDDHWLWLCDNLTQDHSYPHNPLDYEANLSPEIGYPQTLSSLRLADFPKETRYNQLCNKTSNPLYKWRYIKKLVASYEIRTSSDKAGANYNRYVLIETDKDIENMRNTLITDKKLQEIRANLEKKYSNNLVIEQKINEIIAKQKQKLAGIAFFEQTKYERLEKMQFILKGDDKYQHWSELQRIWKKHNFGKIQESVNKLIHENCEKYRISGLNFESFAKIKIKSLLAERYGISVNEIDTVENIIIKQSDGFIGEIDIMAINKRTNKILALIEVKNNSHDIGYANKQLQRILSIITDQEEVLKCSHSSQILNQNRITSNTELLILTRLPSDDDRIGTSIETVREISNMIADDDIMEKIAFEGVCRQNNHDHVWNIMMNLLAADISLRDYDGPFNIIKRFDDRLLILTE